MSLPVQVSDGSREKNWGYPQLETLAHHVKGSASGAIVPVLRVFPLGTIACGANVRVLMCRVFNDRAAVHDDCGAVLKRRSVFDL